MLRLPPLPTVAELLRLYRVSALKQLSQNFLLDSNVSGARIRGWALRFCDLNRQTEKKTTHGQENSADLRTSSLEFVLYEGHLPHALSAQTSSCGWLAICMAATCLKSARGLARSPAPF